MHADKKYKLSWLGTLVSRRDWHRDNASFSFMLREFPGKQDPKPRVYITSTGARLVYVLCLVRTHICFDLLITEIEYELAIAELVTHRRALH